MFLSRRYLLLQLQEQQQLLLLYLLICMSCAALPLPHSAVEPGAPQLQQEARAEIDVDTCEGRIVVGSEGDQDRAFLQSIDFSEVLVSVLSDNGEVLEEEHCSPAGYYLLALDLFPAAAARLLKPITLRVSSPAGFMIYPETYRLESGKCEHEYNFIFQGFRLYGAVVVAGGSAGPAGLTVELLQKIAENPAARFQGGVETAAVAAVGGADLATTAAGVTVKEAVTHTGPGGLFSFQGIQPGVFTLQVLVCNLQREPPANASDTSSITFCKSVAAAAAASDVFTRRNGCADCTIVRLTGTGKVFVQRVGTERQQQDESENVDDVETRNGVLLHLGGYTVTGRVEIAPGSALASPVIVSIRSSRSNCLSLMPNCDTPVPPLEIFRTLYHKQCTTKSPSSVASSCFMRAALTAPQQQSAAPGAAAVDEEDFFNSLSAEVEAGSACVTVAEALHKGYYTFSTVPDCVYRLSPLPFLLTSPAAEVAAAVPKEKATAQIKGLFSAQQQPQNDQQQVLRRVIFQPQHLDVVVNSLQQHHGVISVPLFQLHAFVVSGRVLIRKPLYSFTTDSEVFAKASVFETGGTAYTFVGISEAVVHLRAFKRDSSVFSNAVDQQRNTTATAENNGEGLLGKSMTGTSGDFEMTIESTHLREKEVFWATATKQHYEFSAVSLKSLSWETAAIPPIEVIGVALCGRIRSTTSVTTPTEASTPVFSEGVEVFAFRSSSHTDADSSNLHVRTDKKGRFCFSVPPYNSYVLVASTSSSNKQKHSASHQLQQKNQQQTVFVEDQPILNIELSEQRYSVYGHVILSSAETAKKAQAVGKDVLENEGRFVVRVTRQVQQFGAGMATDAADVDENRQLRKVSAAEELVADVPVQCIKKGANGGEQQQTLFFAVNDLPTGVYNLEIFEAPLPPFVFSQPTIAVAPATTKSQRQTVCWKLKRQQISLPPPPVDEAEKDASFRLAFKQKSQKEPQQATEVSVEFEQRGRAVCGESNFPFTAILSPTASHKNGQQKHQQQRQQLLQQDIPQGNFCVCLPYLAAASYKLVHTPCFDVQTRFLESPSLPFFDSENSRSIRTTSKSSNAPAATREITQTTDVQAKTSNEQLIIFRVQRRLVKAEVHLLLPSSAHLESATTLTRLSFRLLLSVMKMQSKNVEEKSDQNGAAETTVCDFSHLFEQGNVGAKKGAGHKKNPSMPHDDLSTAAAAASLKTSVLYQETQYFVAVYSCSFWLPIGTANETAVLQLLPPAPQADLFIHYEPEKTRIVSLFAPAAAVDKKVAADSIAKNAAGDTGAANSSTACKEIPLVAQFEAQQQCALKGRIVPAVSGAVVSFLDKHTGASIAPAVRTEKDGTFSSTVLVCREYVVASSDVNYQYHHHYHHYQQYNKLSEDLHVDSHLQVHVASEQVQTTEKGVVMTNHQQTPAVQVTTSKTDFRLLGEVDVALQQLLENVMISPSLPGYSFVQQEGGGGESAAEVIFFASKQPTVTAKVQICGTHNEEKTRKTENCEGLKGVLLSISSLGDPRSVSAVKLRTDADGVAVFTLEPLTSEQLQQQQQHEHPQVNTKGERLEKKEPLVVRYRVKPILKGYRFEPSFSSVEISLYSKEAAEAQQRINTVKKTSPGNEAVAKESEEGPPQHVVATFTATKVLFECSGTVRTLLGKSFDGFSSESETSLTGDVFAFPIFTVKATSRPNDGEGAAEQKLHVEEAFVLGDGNFFLRGLRPHTIYRLVVQKQQEHAMPESKDPMQQQRQQVTEKVDDELALDRVSPAFRDVQIDSGDITGVEFFVFAASRGFTVSAALPLQPAALSLLTRSAASSSLSGNGEYVFADLPWKLLIVLERDNSLQQQAAVGKVAPSDSSAYSSEEAKAKALPTISNVLTPSAQRCESVELTSVGLAEFPNVPEGHHQLCLLLRPKPSGAAVVVAGAPSAASERRRAPCCSLCKSESFAGPEMLLYSTFLIVSFEKNKGKRVHVQLPSLLTMSRSFSSEVEAVLRGEMENFYSSEFIERRAGRSRWMRLFSIILGTLLLLVLLLAAGVLYLQMLCKREVTFESISEFCYSEVPYYKELVLALHERIVRVLNVLSNSFSSNSCSSLAGKSLFGKTTESIADLTPTATASTLSSPSAGGYYIPGASTHYSYDQ